MNNYCKIQNEVCRFKRINRKEVDKFLIELNAFLEKHYEQLSEENILDFILPIKMSKPGTFRAAGIIPLPTLVKLINKQGKNGQRTRRTEQFVRKAAYATELHYVKGISYADIFYKILEAKGKLLYKRKQGLILTNFHDKYGEDFILPVEYGHINTDLLYEGGYLLPKQNLPFNYK